MYPWITWKVWSPIIFAMSLCIVYINQLINKQDYSINHSKKIQITLLLLMILWSFTRSTIGGAIELFALFLVCISVICLNDSSKINILNFITKWFSILLLFSLILYILHIIGINMPYSTISYYDMANAGSFDNYYLFLWNSGQLISRFQSIFLEPGHLTMGLIPLIFINKCDLKNKYVLFLILSQLFTLSLAGYISLAYSFLFYLLVSNKNIKSKFIFLFWIIVMVILIIKGINYLFADDILKEQILNRLTYENGSIAGYNRTTDSFDTLYNQVLSSGWVWTGINWDHFAYDGVSGYKPYIITYGLIGVILTLSFYLYSTNMYKNARVKGLSVLLLMLLFQNAYTLWICMLFSAILGPVKLLQSDE